MKRRTVYVERGPAPMSYTDKVVRGCLTFVVFIIVLNLVLFVCGAYKVLGLWK